MMGLKGVAHRQGDDQSKQEPKSNDPLEIYCDDNPEADECRCAWHGVMWLPRHTSPPCHRESA